MRRPLDTWMLGGIESLERHTYPATTFAHNPARDIVNIVDSEIGVASESEIIRIIASLICSREVAQLWRSCLTFFFLFFFLLFFYFFYFSFLSTKRIQLLMNNLLLGPCAGSNLPSDVFQSIPRHAWSRSIFSLPLYHFTWIV